MTINKVLVTGAGGAIGVHMLAHLMEHTTWDILALDSFNHKGYYDRIATLFDEHPNYDRSRLTVVRHDLTAPITERQIEKWGAVDYIVHLASLSDVQDSINDPVPFVRNNVDLQLNVLEYARAIELKAFIQFSTDEVYGPDTDNGLAGHPEWDTILPSNPYAASKAAQEAIAISYWRSYGVPVVITNTMNNFGEMQAPSKYVAMIQQKVQAGDAVTVHAASDGTIGTRYYLHSRTAADAVLWILRHIDPYLHKPGEADRPDRYNIVGNVILNNLEMAQKVAGAMDEQLHYRIIDFHSKQPGHDLHYGLSGEKLAAAGWQPRLSFDESLKLTIEWQKKHPEWMQ